jgi:hypothetical protein
VDAATLIGLAQIGLAALLAADRGRAQRHERATAPDQICFRRSQNGR